MYHERQRLSLCGVHAVNNLLQEHHYGKADFDRVCEELAPGEWINPHRSMLRIGNFDVNVLMVLLERAGMTVQWQDGRKELETTQLEEYGRDAAVFGLIVNLPSTSLWGRLTKGRHWLTLLWQPSSNQWVNLDSDLKEPFELGDMDACVQKVKEWRVKQECHVLLVKKVVGEGEQKK